MTATLVLHDGHETTYEMVVKELTVDNTLVETSAREFDKSRQFFKQNTMVILRGFVTKKVR
jgi:hypothetical protein